ncbi:myosin-10-like [Pseudoliparis swirei]|uniref:myosin-10-like n=1 Tax=Pseudoliparis swirei TaxID=2059687 RepID=UPI0024BD7521|nr:myosin-10-like [Pseudoliparis swirei]
MTGVHNFLNGTQPDAMGQVGTEGSYHVVLESSPPDYMEKISRYLSSSMGQGRRDNVSTGPAEAESDSGDSLFITQKEATLPKDVRSDRLHQYIRDLEESESSSSSVSHSGEFKTSKLGRRKNCPLPKYSFPFLEKREGKLRSSPVPDQNKSLNYYILGGFFKCLGELRQSSQRGPNLESSFPTVDMDGEDISPLSEDDGEKSEDEEIKVVERKHFLVSSKRTSQQRWCNQLNRQKRSKDHKAGRETSGRGETERPHIKPSEGNGEDAEQLQSGAVAEPRSDDAEIQKRKRKKKRKGSAEDAQQLHSGAVAELQIDDAEIQKKKKKKKKKKKRKGSAEDAEQLHSGAVAELQIDDSEIQKKKKKKRKGSAEDAEQLHSGAVTEPRIDDAEIQKKKKMKGSAEDAEQLHSGAVAELQIDDSEIQKKKKKKKRKGSAEDAEQLHSGAVTEPRIDDAEIQKKKKMKGSAEDAEQLHSGAVTEPQIDDAEIQKKKKKNKKRKGSAEDAEQLHSGAVAELQIDDSEIQKKKKKKRKGSAEDAEQLHSGAVTEPRIDDAEIQKKKKMKGSAEDAEQLHSGAVAELQIDDSEIQKKKKKKKRKGSAEDAEQLHSGAVTEPRIDDAEIQKKKKMKGSAEDAEQLHSGAVTEPQIDDAEIQKKKKKNKKRKGSAGNAEQLQYTVSGAVAEPQIDDAEIKKKKKKMKGSAEDAEQLQSGAEAGPQIDDAEIQKKKKKKKRKKELRIEIAEENEEEASNGTLDLPPMSTEQLEESGNCLENTAAPQEPLGSSLVKTKKHKKKHHSSNDATQDEKEGVDVSFSPEDSVTMAKCSSKNKRKTFFEEMNVFHTPKENVKFKNASNQKTNEGLKDQNTESVTKKKKKSDILSRGVSEDRVAQSDDSVSKRKKRHSSFLVADAEESCAQTYIISPSACRAGAGRKRKMERTGNESEGLDSAADAGFSANDEAVVLKKKKKVCNSVIVEAPPTATTVSPVSRKEKRNCDASTETLTSVKCDLASSETVNDTKTRKRRRKNDEKLLTKSAESEPGETRGKERSEQPPVGAVTSETPLTLRKKHRKLKRKLLNPTVESFYES